MAILVDTNVLLRSVQPESAMHRTAVAALVALMERREELVVAMQNIAEFWNTATRPVSSNGLGFSIEEAWSSLAKLEEFFGVLTESPRSYQLWKSLVIEQRVQGVQVHDARLAAVMKAHDIRQVLTFNSADFTRYPGLEVIHPASLVNHER